MREPTQKISRKALPGATLVATLMLSVAGSAMAEETRQTWTAINLSGQISGDWFTHSDVQFRLFDNESPVTVMLRPGLSRRIAPGMFLTLGYVWAPFWRARQTVNFVDEHRLWQQWMYEMPLGTTPLKLALRARLEERLRPMSAFEIGMRLRLQARLSMRLSDRVHASLTDEFMIALNTTDWSGAGQFAGYDQNRVSIMLGYYYIAEHARIEIGYMNVLVRRPTNSQGDLMSHNLLIHNTFSF